MLKRNRKCPALFTNQPPPLVGYFDSQVDLQAREPSFRHLLRVQVLELRDHRKLDAFHLADSLVIRIYETTKTFPKSELYGLASQMRRASVSVVANIVEGCARRSEKEFLRFLDFSFGSLREVGYYIDLSMRLRYLSSEDFDFLSETQSRTAAALAALIRSFRTEFD
ncbi:MAG: four helix bundle protein [Thermoanaerobaculia bacterium]